MQEVLAKYNITKGFLIPCNNARLSENKEWEQVLDKLPLLLTSRKLRSSVDKLPPFNLQIPDNEWEHAYLVISFISQAYVWADRNNVCQVLPCKLGIPWMWLSEKLGLKPVISYAAVELFNFDLIDPMNGWELRNFKVHHTFTGKRDEEWFYLISIAIESKSTSCLPIIMSMYEAVDNLTKGGKKSKWISVLIDNLNALRVILREIVVLLGRMDEENDPQVFYHQVRPYMTGWENAVQLPSEGLFYHGVIKNDDGIFRYDDNSEDGTFLNYAGGSAGQSPLMHVLDIALGIRHYPTGTNNNSEKHRSTYIYEMRKYMPKNHQDFIKYLESLASVKDYLHQNSSAENEAAQKPYNACVDELKKFRDLHIRIVTRYIIIPGKQKYHLEDPNKNIKEEEEAAEDFDSGEIKRLSSPLSPVIVDDLDAFVVRGTGGTDLVPFLKQMRDETDRCITRKE